MRAGTNKGPKAAGRSKTKATRKRGYHTVTVPVVDDSGEFFDLNAISMDSDDSDDGVPPAPTLMNIRTKTPLRQVIRTGPFRLPHVSNKPSLVPTVRRKPNPAAEMPGITSSPLGLRSNVDRMRDAVYSRRDTEFSDSKGDVDGITSVSEGEVIADVLSLLRVSSDRRSSSQTALVIEVSD
jgi:hypothetical protein